MGTSKRLLRRVRRDVKSGIRSRWGGLFAVMAVLLVLELLATTGFVKGVMGPARAGSPGTYFAEGDIHGANPFSSDVAGVTEAELIFTCTYPPESQGVDGYVFQLPEDFLLPAPFTVTGESESPEYDLNVFLYNEACELVESVDTTSPDESGEIPAGIRYVVVDQFIGAETHVTLCAGDPKGCVPASSGSTSPSSTSTTTPPPGEGDMSTTLKSNRHIARYKQNFTLSGVVSGDDECGPPNSHRVGVTKRVLGTTETKSVDRTIPVEPDGSWSIQHSSANSAEYIARVSPSETCESQASDPVTVHVRVEIDITEDPKDCSDNVAGIVRPNHKGTKVVLQRHEDKKYRPTGKEDTLNDESKFNLPVNRCGLFRVVWPGQAPSNKWSANKFIASNDGI